jgi:hypothetical protein
MTLLRVEPSAIWPSPEATVRAAPTAWIAVRGRLVVTASSAKLCPGSDPGCRDGALVFGLDTKGLMARQRQLNGPDTYMSGSRIWLAHVQGSSLVDLTAATGYASS